MRVYRSVTLALLSLPTAAVIGAASLPAQQVPGPAEQAAQEFLSAKRAAQNAAQTRLDGNGRGAGVPQLRRLVATSSLAGDPGPEGIAPQTRALLRDSLVTDAAHSLAAADLAPDRIAALQKAGFNPLDAAINLVR